MFFFSEVSIYDLVSLWVSSLTCYLSMCCLDLYVKHVRKSFSFPLVINVYLHSIVVRKYILYICVHLNELIIVLLPNIWSILKNYIVLEENVHPAVFWGGMFYMSYCLDYCIINSSISLLVFCLFILYIMEREVLKAPTIVIE